MNKLQIWWHTTILGKEIVQRKEGFFTYSDTFFKIENNPLDFKTIYNYKLIDDYAAFRNETGLTYSTITKITHNKVITAMVNRNLISFNDKNEIRPGKESIGRKTIVYNHKTFILAYDVMFNLNLYELTI